MPKRIFTLEAKKKKTAPLKPENPGPQEKQPFNTVGYLHEAIGNRHIQQLYEEGRIQALLPANQPHNTYEVEANRIAALLASGEKTTVKVKQRTGKPKLLAKLLGLPGKKQKEKNEQALVEEKIKNLPFAQELTPEDKEFFTSHFAQNFDDVKLHTGRQAEEMAGGIGARAFTLDNHIVFGKDQLAPDTPEGRELLAHELTHVVQQSPQAGDGPAAETLPAEEAQQFVREPFGENTAPLTETEKEAVQAEPAEQETCASGEADALQVEPAEQKASTSGEADALQTEEKIEAAAEEEAAADQILADSGQEGVSSEAADTAAQSQNEAGQDVQPAADLSAGNPGGQAGPSGQGREGKSGAPPNKTELHNELPASSPAGTAGLLTALGQTPGSQILDTFNKTVTAAGTRLTEETEAVQESLPKIKAPTGLPEATETTGPQVSEPTFAGSEPGEWQGEKAGAAGEDASASPAGDKADSAKKPDFTGPDNILKKQAASDGERAAQAEAAIDGIQLSGEQIPTSLGAPPVVALTGEADPARMNTFTAESAETMQQAQAEAFHITAEDFGENNLLPEKDNTLIQAKKEVQIRQLAVEQEADGGLPVIPAELTAEVDKEMSSVLQPQIQEQEEKYQAAQEDYQAESVQARAENEAKVQQMEAETQAQQEAEQSRAQAAIDGHKSDFQAGVAQVDADFKDKARSASDDQQAKINEEKTKGTTTAARHFSEAEQKARTEQSKAETQVAAEKQKAKKEQKSFWDNICDTVSSFVDKLKSAVSAIFEGLRALVKGIFEAAKKLALAAIDLARKAITGLIKVFGTVLKGLVKVAFAAFPKLQKALLDKINNAINTALAVLNKAADFLKKGVAAAFDFLAKVIDTLLGIVQAAYEAALEAIKFIVRGEFGELAKYIFKAALRIVGSGIKEFMAMLGLDTTALDKIIEDPIGFLKNLIAAVKGGIGAFVNNIVPHLTSGMAAWLFGTFQGAANIMLPQSFDLSGMLFFVLQILNLTWASLRGQIVKEMGPGGDQVMDQAEKGLDFISELVTKGPIAIVDRIKEFVGNIKETFFGAIIEWLRNTLIIKGIEKLVMLLNPAGAIIAAIQAIYNIVRFFIERWQQIQSFCEAVMNSVKEIAGGSIGTAIGWIEKSLARFIPVTLGFLARFIGLGGIVEKVKGVIKKIRKPVDKAIKKTVGFLAKKIKNSKIFKSLSRTYDKGKKKVENFKEKRKQRQDEKRRAKEEKEKNKKEKPEKLTAEDKQKHKKYAREIITELKEDKGAKENSFTEFYKKKQELAARLEATYQNRLKRGINVDVKLEPLNSAKKDNDINIKVKIAPNDTEQIDTIKQDGKDQDEQDGIEEVTKRVSTEEKVYIIKVKGLDIVIDENQTIEAFLKTNKENFSAIDYESYDAALIEVKAIQDTAKRIQRATNGKDLYDEQVKTKVKELNHNITLSMDALSSIMLKLMDVNSDDIEYPKPTKTALSNGFLVENQSAKNFDPGSSPSEDSTGWICVRDHLKLSKFWVRMHLVSEKLGGPGINSNLVPGPKTVNAQMDKFAERTLKALLGKTNEESYKKLGLKIENVIWVRSTAQFYRASELPEGIDQKFRQENSWAKSVRVEAGLHFFNGKSWEKTGTRHQNTFVVPLPAVEGKPPLNFNAAKRAELPEMKFEQPDITKYGITRDKFKAQFDKYFPQISSLGLICGIMDLRNKMKEKYSLNNSSYPQMLEKQYGKNTPKYKKALKKFTNENTKFNEFIFMIGVLEKAGLITFV